MIAANMVRLEPQSKRLMDTLRITVRNLFYRALEPFKKAYDNYRDDHDYFRRLTLSSGVLEMGAERVTVHLMATPVICEMPSSRSTPGKRSVLGMPWYESEVGAAPSCANSGPMLDEIMTSVDVSRSAIGRHPPSLANQEVQKSGRGSTLLHGHSGEGSFIGFLRLVGC